MLDTSFKYQKIGKLKSNVVQKLIDMGNIVFLTKIFESMVFTKG